jgi:hypothetical protein
MDTIEIDLNRLSYKAYREFLAAGAQGDEIGLLCQVVVRWPFPGEPQDRASYDRLGVLDVIAVQQALRQAITAAAAGN